MTGEVARIFLQRAAMAGIIIGVFYLTNFSIVSVFAGLEVGGEPLTGVGRLVGGLAFGWALVFIYYTKSELLTSNMMVVTVGMYHRRTTLLRSLRIMGLCLFGNFLGGLVIALLMMGSTLAGGGVGEQMASSVAHKLEYITLGVGGWSDLFIRAILCNFMINIAMTLIWNGFIKEDLTRALAMITAVFIFAFLGFEHSVANTVLFTIVGLTQGIDVGLAAANVAIALVGNYIGGGLLIGLYYAWANDHRRYLRLHPELAEEPPVAQ
nr:formate/nitrite transporter family protein [Propioniciclava soli]